MELNFNNKTEFETFFMTVFDNATNKNTSYLKMPTSTCFTYCVKEIKYALYNELNNDKIRKENSKKLCEIFYEFMQKDVILKKYDFLEYTKLMVNLKLYCEGDKISKLEKYAYFDHLHRRMCWQYFKELVETIKQKYTQNVDFEIDKNIIYTFINELLAKDYDYLYLGHACKMYKNRQFDSFLAFIDYLCIDNSDSVDIYLPISKPTETEMNFFNVKSQQINVQNDITYCHIYDNRNDFVTIIKDNIIRIESLFNILRFYTNSHIDFLWDKKIQVKSKHFDTVIEVEFGEIIRYVGVKPNYYNLKGTIETFDCLKSNYVDLYHKLLNTLSYAEKDKDIMNASSFVDNWISLETLVSLSGRENGFDAVLSIVPKILVAKLLMNDILNTLEHVNKRTPNKRNKDLEKFIYNVINGTYNFDRINNIAYRHEAERLAGILTNLKTLQQEFEATEQIVKNDLLRIYMLRNEYVHASNLQYPNTMQHFKLKQILPYCLDEVFKNLYYNVRNNKYSISKFGISYDVYSDILTRYNNRIIVFNMLNTKTSQKNGKIVLYKNISELDISYEDLLMNILKNNTKPLKKYSEDYE